MISYIEWRGWGETDDKNCRILEMDVGSGKGYPTVRRELQKEVLKARASTRAWNYEKIERGKRRELAREC